MSDLLGQKSKMNNGNNLLHGLLPLLQSLILLESLEILFYFLLEMSLLFVIDLLGGSS